MQYYFLSRGAAVRCFFIFSRQVPAHVVDGVPELTMNAKNDNCFHRRFICDWYFQQNHNGNRCAMTMKTGNLLSAGDHSGLSRQPAPPSQFLRWINGGAHWISAVVLLYAFVFNGETSRAMINPVAMRGEVNLGLIVGFIFLIRFIWVRSRRSAGGRWAAASLRMPQRSTIRRLTDWSIYLGVALTVVSGLMIAYLRPGVEIIPGRRGFLTLSPALNAAIITHVHASTVLQWLCAFHVVYFLWCWKIKPTRWGRVMQPCLDRVASVAYRVGMLRLTGRN